MDFPIIDTNIRADTICLSKEYEQFKLIKLPLSHIDEKGHFTVPIIMTHTLS